MAEAVVEPLRNASRFFCHRCNVEFEDNLQEYTCPYCATGFIERLEHDRDSESLVSGAEDGDYSDADMSNLEDGSNMDDSLGDSLDDLTRQNSQGQPVLNDLAFLMTGGRLGRRPMGRRTESLMEQLVWMIGGRGGPGGAVTAGSPFVLVGAPGDYVFGGEGLDAVVTQLLGQLENTGPPPLSRDLINAIPSEKITASQVEANMSCSVCWDNFTLDETVSRLECEHIFHPACITPWLQLHATCPICRRSLATEPPPGAAGTAAAPLGDVTPASSASSAISATSATSATSAQGDLNTPSFSRVVVRRINRRRRSNDDSSSGSSVTPGTVWAHLASTIAAASEPSTAPASRGSSDTYMDIDYD